MIDDEEGEGKSTDRHALGFGEGKGLMHLDSRYGRVTGKRRWITRLMVVC